MKNAYFADYIYYDGQVHNNSWLLVDDDIITDIITDITQFADYTQKKFNNSAIFPGLINTHTHLGMSYFRGLADDLPLMTWLNDHIWPAEKKHVSPQFVYDATMLSIAESIRSGVTCLNDMYFEPASVSKAYNDANIRGIACFGIMGGSIDKAITQLENMKSSEFATYSIALHALYTVPYESFKACIEYATRKNVQIHTHLAETKDELNIVKDKYNMTPTEVMHELGALDINTILAHCVHVTDSDVALLAAGKASVSHCISSNLKLASGFAPITKMADTGVNITIGTDGAASNNNQSVLKEMSMTSKLQKAIEENATAMPAQQVLDMATKNAGIALGFDNIGELKQGYKADFFVLSFDNANVTPVYNPVSHLVYAAEPADITDVFINGKQVMADKEILTFDEQKVKENARLFAKSIS